MQHLGAALIDLRVVGDDAADVREVAVDDRRVGIGDRVVERRRLAAPDALEERVTAVSEFLYSSAKYVANPSLSHTSSQSASVTESPKYWCAISWAMSWRPAPAAPKP